jgi:hypothetical protein
VRSKRKKLQKCKRYLNRQTRHAERRLSLSMIEDATDAVIGHAEFFDEYR